MFLIMSVLRNMLIFFVFWNKISTFVTWGVMCFCEFNFFTLWLYVCILGRYGCKGIEENKEFEDDAKWGVRSGRQC